VAGAEETYIVRVRRDERDAVVEEIRSRRLSYVRDLTEVGALIAGRLAASHDADSASTDRASTGEEQLR
jgi:hypothetical protein